MRIHVVRLFGSVYLRRGLGLAVSALTLYLALRNVTLSEIWAALTQADAGFVGLALLNVAVNTLAKAFRWRVFLGRAGARISVFRVLQVLLVGQMLNTLYPARIGDLSRVYMLGSQGLGRAFCLGTLLLEKLVDLLSYTLLFLLLVFLVPLPAWIDDSVYTFSLVILVASAAVIFLAYRPQAFLCALGRLAGGVPTTVQAYINSRFRSVMDSLEVLHSRRVLFSLVAWSALIWGTAILNNHLVLLAIGIDLPWTASLLVLMVLMAGISIPSVPGKIGIFEYSCILALAVYGIGQAPALSYGIVLHSIVLLPTTLLGLLYFWLHGLGAGHGRLVNHIRENRLATSEGRAEP